LIFTKSYKSLTIFFFTFRAAKIEKIYNFAKVSNIFDLYLVDSPFIYTRSLDNDPFIGRQNEIDWLSSNLMQGVHTMIVEPSFSGKQSLINQGFLRVQKQKAPKKICYVPLFNIRSWDDFLTHLAERAADSFVNTLTEWKSLCLDLLPLNNPTVKIDERKMNSLHLSFSPKLSEKQREELFAFPERVCYHFQEQLVVYMSDFQCVNLFDDSYPLLTSALKTWRQHTQTTYLISASKPNAMHALDGNREILKKVFEHIPLTPIDERLFTDHIVRGFSKAGRVISKELAELLYRKMEGHPFYTQHFAHLCFVNTKGFMNNAMYQQAFEELLEIYHRPFTAITDDLTPPQINFLKAVTHNVERFCTSDVLKKYELNSSANVTRVRMALEKKEILYFKRNKPFFIDPLFKIWFSERFTSPL